MLRSSRIALKGSHRTLGVAGGASAPSECTGESAIGLPVFARSSTIAARWKIDSSENRAPSASHEHRHDRRERERYRNSALRCLCACLQRHLVRDSGTLTPFVIDDMRELSTIYRQTFPERLDLHHGSLWLNTLVRLAQVLRARFWPSAKGRTKTHKIGLFCAARMRGLKDDVVE